MVSAHVKSDARISILGDKSSFPPSEVRTLRLSTPSLLSSTLSEETSPLYRTITEGRQTFLKRFDKPVWPQGAPNALCTVAVICWATSDPAEPSPSWARHLYKDSRSDMISVELDGRRLKATDLLKLTSWGSTRKFSLDGRTFKWKRKDGLWQCFHDKSLIVVFEPSIVTTNARIRILPTELALTRKTLDMILLTCLLVVSEPNDWRNHQQAVQASQYQPGLAHHHSAPVGGSLPLNYDNTRAAMRRTQSERAGSTNYTPAQMIYCPASPTPPRALRSTPSLSRLSVSRPSTPKEVPDAVPAANSMRRVASNPNLLSPFGHMPGLPRSAHSTPGPPAGALKMLSASFSSPVSPSPAMKILSRTNSTSHKQRTAEDSLRRSSSSISSVTDSNHRRRPTAIPGPPVMEEREPYSRSSLEADTPSADGGEGQTVVVPRPWELRGAYPLPYTAVATPSGTATPPASRSDVELIPPPYARRGWRPPNLISASSKASGPRRRQSEDSTTPPEKRAAPWHLP